MRPTEGDKAAAQGAIARQNHARKIRAILRARRAANPNYDRERLNKRVQARIAAKLRGRLIAAFRNNAKRGAAIRELGCTIAALKVWLASLFEPGMTFGNYGTWHIDHITPLSFFDLTDRAQVLVACNWKNLQPLWALDNIAKGAKTLWQPGLFAGLMSEAG